MDRIVKENPQSPENTSQDATESWTVRRILDWTTAHLTKHGSDSPRLDAEVLLAFARKCERIRLYTNYEDEVSSVERTLMRELVQRRAKSEPVAYLVGNREFFGLDFMNRHVNLKELGMSQLFHFLKPLLLYFIIMILIIETIFI